MRRNLLIVSILLNIALVVVAIWAFRALEPIAAPPTPVAAAPSNIIQKVTRTRQVKEADKTVALKWKDVESSDYKTFIANLRATGCPEETLRDIVIADINKLYSQKWK